MEDTFKNMLFAFILIGLFGTLILTAVVTSGGNYGKDTSQVVGGSLALDKFNSSISNIQRDAEILQNRFEQKSVWSSVAGIVLIGIFGIAKDMVVMILTPFNLLSNILSDVIGVPAYVTSVILGILILSIIFGLWRLLKVGD